MTRLWSNESREKLIWGRELYVDSTQVNADLDSLTPRFAVEARKEIQTHLAALFAAEESQQEQEKEATEVVTALPVVLPEAEQEELSGENAARHDWIAEQGRPQREVRGYYQRTSDLRISTTDPDATPMRLKRGGTHLGYHFHYVVDGGKARIILQVLVTPSEVMDNQTPTVPSRGPLCLFFGCCWVVCSSFFAIYFCFLVYWPTLSREQDRACPILLMSFVKEFFNRLGGFWGTMQLQTLAAG